MPLALITDCEGPLLSDAEKAFFEKTQPFGFILFQRHCETPEQVRALTQQLQACVSHPAPIFIDQEGGRVARLKPPHWEAYPPAGDFARLYKTDRFAAEQACYLNARLIADDLSCLGITGNCAPLADLRFDGAHDIISDRAFGTEAEQVTALARAQAWGLMDGGILPVLKHIPGHGRAQADSHEELPVVDVSAEMLEAHDFKPFQLLSNLPLGMTAHIRYSAYDTAPATLSEIVIKLIREQIGFAGLLMSDDISMKALNGDLETIAKQALAAGCDLVLHCNGSLEERQQVAAGCTAMPQSRYALYDAARRAIAEPMEIDRVQLHHECNIHMEPLRD